MLAGCVNSGGVLSVFDPAPYDPTNAPDTRTDVACLADGSKCPAQDYYSFTDLLDARKKMSVLAARYADHRDTMMRGAELLDIPPVGLLATLVVATGNHFASTTILGLSVASVGTVGVKTYIGPSAKAAAYGGASSALQCGAAGADRLLYIQDHERPDLAYEALAIKIAAAPQGTSTTDAATASKNLAAAIATLNGATERLGFLTSSIVRNTTKRVTTGVQDVSALLSQLQALAPAVNAKPASKTPAPAGGVAPVAAAALPAPPNYSQMSLEELTATAIALATEVKDAWADLTGCIVVSPP